MTEHRIMRVNGTCWLERRKSLLGFTGSWEPDAVLEGGEVAYTETFPTPEAVVSHYRDELRAGESVPVVDAVRVH